MRLWLALLGPLQVRLDDQLVSGLAYSVVCTLLIYLAVEARPHGRDTLAALLWPDQPYSSARRGHRVAQSGQRHAIGDPTASVRFLIARRESVQVNTASDITLDLTIFDQLLRDGAQHVHPAGALCMACAARLSEAVTPSSRHTLPVRTSCARIHSASPLTRAARA